MHTTSNPWGIPPWQIDFAPPAAPLPKEADFVVVGAGFTGLAAAAWLRLLAPDKTVAVLEASRVGAGASGRTGGMVLGETAAGDEPGLGDVLAGFKEILAKLGADCDLAWPGAWEIGRSGGAGPSPIEWNDSGKLRVMHEVPGGTLDPGKLVSGLGRAAHGLGAGIFENARVKNIDWSGHPLVRLEHGEIRPGKILLATNALSTKLSGLAGAEPRLTLAVASEPLREEQLREIGLGERKPFYTTDFPYLWGRVRADNSVIWGSGLVAAPSSRNLASIDITSEDCRRLLSSLETRVRGLHPALRSIGFTHRWGGPILFRESWVPVFDWHPQSMKKSRTTTGNAIVLGAYAGHGVALSSYLGAWAAEALLGRRDLPEWGRISR
jgi:glycine/D-amino acid oxidase-like deaminating enzyme